MKRIAIVLCAILLAICICACGKQEPSLEQRIKEADEGVEKSRQELEEALENLKKIDYDLYLRMKSDIHW